jgi:phosphate transport system substrate-binding protein
VVNAWLKKGTMALSIAALAFTAAACGAGNQQAANNQTQGGGETLKPVETTKPAETKLTGEIKIDGSSTVFPISQAVAEEFMKKNNGVKVTVALSGSSNGIKKIISGEIDIADSSRKIKSSEADEIKKKGDEPVEMAVAYDGITVVIHPKNDWATEMTVEELKKIWQKDSTVKNWSEVRAGWPDKPIKLYGPGTASGTFEYFTEAINGVAKESRSDYTPSEDDNVLVKGVSGDEYAMGYFGFSYFVENKDKLKAVKIKKDANSPAIEASVKTIEDGSYVPLSRPIYIYPLKSALAKPEVKEFIKYYMSAEGQQLAEAVGYVKLPQSQYDANLAHVK